MNNTHSTTAIDRTLLVALSITPQCRYGRMATSPEMAALVAAGYVAESDFAHTITAAGRAHLAATRGSK
jgi:hypothetical protein